MSDIPKGYKQTEVGVIPEDWDVDCIVGVSHIQNGGTPSSSQTRFWNGGIPWCTPTDITALNGHKYLIETARTISEAGLKSCSAETVPMFSVIMTSRATIGECAINTVPMTTNQGFKNLLPKDGVDCEFLYYLMTTQKSRLMAMCAGSTFLEISKKQLSSFEIALPPTEAEQRAIATALSDVDALLEGLDRLIAKKRDLKQAAMQGLLSPPATTAMDNGELKMENEGNSASANSQFTTLNSPLNIRLPGLLSPPAKTVMDNGELKMENEGSSNNSQCSTPNSPSNIRLPGFEGEWEVKRLGDIGCCLRGVSYRGDSDLSTHDTANTKRLLRSNNVQDAVVVTSEVQFVNTARVSSNQVLKKSDILICMANGSKALVGKAGFFAVEDGYEYTFGAFMGCFRTDSSIVDPRFVFSLFQIGQYRDYINNLLAGSSINNLRPSSIESLEFSMPSRLEQTAIAAVLSDMDDEIAALEQRRNKTKDIKQAMMQELLTGKTRLVNG